MKIRFLAVMISVSISAFLLSYNQKKGELNLDIYQYRHTKNLVKFVYDNAGELREKSINYLNHFAQNRESYKMNDYNLYIYELDGTNVFHSGMPELEAKNLFQHTDINGKKPTELVLAGLENKNNPHAWIHYTWWTSGNFYPVPTTTILAVILNQIFNLDLLFNRRKT